MIDAFFNRTVLRWSFDWTLWFILPFFTCMWNAYNFYSLWVFWVMQLTWKRIFKLIAGIIVCAKICIKWVVVVRWGCKPIDLCLLLWMRWFTCFYKVSIFNILVLHWIKSRPALWYIIRLTSALSWLSQSTHLNNLLEWLWRFLFFLFIMNCSGVFFGLFRFFI